MSEVFDVINLSLEPSEEFREELDTLARTSPYLWDAFNGEYKALERQLQNGADVNNKSKYGNTALIIACWLNKVDLVNLLLRYGANKHIQNNKKETALSTAISMRNTRIVHMLENPPPPQQQNAVVLVGGDGPCAPVLSVPKLDPRIAMMGRCRDVNLPSWMTHTNNAARPNDPPRSPLNRRLSYLPAHIMDPEHDVDDGLSAGGAERRGRSRDVNLSAWLTSNGGYGAHSHDVPATVHNHQDSRQFEDVGRGSSSRLSRSPVNHGQTRHKRSFQLACEPIAYAPAQLQRPRKASHGPPPEPSSWLAHRLRLENVGADWVLLCEEQLVQEEGFGTAETLASVATERFTRLYLNRLGITSIGVQQVLFRVHEDLHIEYLQRRSKRILLDEQPELSDHFVILRSATVSDVASQVSSVPSQHESAHTSQRADTLAPIPAPTLTTTRANASSAPPQPNPRLRDGKIVVPPFPPRPAARPTSQPTQQQQTSPPESDHSTQLEQGSHNATVDLSAGCRNSGAPAATAATTEPVPKKSKVNAKLSGLVGGDIDFAECAADSKVTWSVQRSPGPGITVCGSSSAHRYSGKRDITSSDHAMNSAGDGIQRGNDGDAAISGCTAVKVRGWGADIKDSQGVDKSGHRAVNTDGMRDTDRISSPQPSVTAVAHTASNSRDCGDRYHTADSGTAAHTSHRTVTAGGADEVVTASDSGVIKAGTKRNRFE